MHVPVQCYQFGYLLSVSYVSNWLNLVLISRSAPSRDFVGVISTHCKPMLYFQTDERILLLILSLGSNFRSVLPKVGERQFSFLEVNPWHLKWRQFWLTTGSVHWYSTRLFNFRSMRRISNQWIRSKVFEASCLPNKGNVHSNRGTVILYGKYYSYFTNKIRLLIPCPQSTLQNGPFSEVSESYPISTLMEHTEWFVVVLMAKYLTNFVSIGSKKCTDSKLISIGRTLSSALNSWIFTVDR